MNPEIKDHFLVPRHEILSDEQVREVLMRYRVDRSKLPKIFINDPALPEGAKIGDVVKITRRSETAGEAIYYRVVIEQTG